MSATRQVSPIRMATLALCLVGAFATVAAGEPSIERLEPPQVYVDEDTDVRLAGQGFEPGAVLATATGGPFIAGSYDTPGDARDVTVVGDLAYVADYYDGGLQILDVSDPSDPTLVGSYDTPGRTHDVAVAGSYAYIADGRNSGLQILDVSDPSDPTWVGSYETTGFADGVTVVGAHAYVTDAGSRDSSLLIIDVSDPYAPTLAGSLPTPGRPDGVVVAGDYAYVADAGSRGAGLMVVDVRDPYSPILAGSYPAPGGAEGVAVAGDYAYATSNGNDELLVIDVSDPHAPTLAGSHPLPDFADDVVVAGGFAYVATGSTFGGGGVGLVVIDVNDPRAPVLAGSAMTPGAAQGVAVAGDDLDRAYVADFSAGLHVVDLVQLREPAIAGSLALPSDAADVTVGEDYAYVPADRGLHVVDIRDPERPVLSGSVPLDPYARQVVPSGPLAYVANLYTGLQVIDIGDPGAPALVGGYDPDDVWGPTGYRCTTWSVAREGNFVFLALRYYHPDYYTSGGLEIVDVSDPEAPALVTWVETVREARQVAVWQGHVYLATYREVMIFDVSDPPNPVQVGGLDFPVDDFAFAGQHAYVTDGARLRILDVSDPRSPVLVGTYRPQGGAADVAVAGDYAYVTATSTGMHVVDVSDPTAPVPVGSYDTPGWSRGVAVVGEHVLVADGPEGLQVIRPNSPLRDVSVEPGTTILATVPAGFTPGPYDVRVTNPGGEAHTLHNGLLACLRRELTASLEPVVDLGQSPIGTASIPWRITLEGDGVFFEPRIRHEAVLALPALPSGLETGTRPGDGSGRMAIELRLFPVEDRGELVFEGDDPERVAALWQEIEAAGALPLPRLDDDAYGDVLLGVSRPGERDAPQWPPAARASDDPVRQRQAPILYRYDFSPDGVMTGAHARGRGVDLVFEATGEDIYRCAETDTIRFVETRRALCEQLAGENPGLAFACDP